MFYYKLNNRSLISFEGKDVVSFLQAIITNNVNKLKANRSIYSALLTPQGKILNDFFLFKNNNKIHLDTSKDFLKDLEKKLDLYKLNRDIKIIKLKSFSYFIFYGDSFHKIFNLLPKEGFYKTIDKRIIFNDPRKLNLGCRIICLDKKNENEIKKIIKRNNINKNFYEYEKLRILNCIPDIKKDGLYNNAYMLQYNFDNINAICWKKGCYVGQEVTSRMKHKGSVKKKLYTIKSYSGNFKKEVYIKKNNEIIGKVTSYCENIALGLMEIKKIQSLKKEKNILII